MSNGGSDVPDGETRQDHQKMHGLQWKINQRVVDKRELSKLRQKCTKSKMQCVLTFLMHSCRLPCQRRKQVNMPVQINPRACGPCVVLEKGQKMLCIQAPQATRGMLQAALLWKRKDLNSTHGIRVQQIARKRDHSTQQHFTWTI